MLQGDSPRMPCIHTSIHDASVLMATCRQLRVPAPQEGCVQLDALEVSGWIVRLRELHYPIVCDTLTGLVAYNPRDNAFFPYRTIMQFLHNYGLPQMFCNTTGCGHMRNRGEFSIIASIGNVAELTR